ncbi:uncharacterized protein LOC130903741 [Diorhabda carinulata]|uniref:uncharacterized protein LOC130903741 n=1 Tax=Diorhabda carinulata TaxID=1163345 RepID=UPI0025A06CBF|nr:uncharacterized protein LOC130903741 [Diorhabda carinulata]
MMHLTKFIECLNMVPSTKRSLNTDVSENYILQKRPRYCDYTRLLPDEVLIYVFSFMTHKELHILRRVCKRWFYLSCSPSLWKKVIVNEDIPLKTVCMWLEHSPLLKELEVTVKGRREVNLIVKKLSKYAKNLQTLRIKNSVDTNSLDLLESRALCQMFNNCKYLRNLYFTGVKILSCKFFQLLSQRKPLGTTRNFSYFGPIGQKQMKALITSIVSNENYNAATICTSGNRKINIKDAASTDSGTPDIDTIWNDIVSNCSELFDDLNDEDFRPVDY